jgi:Fic family protein
VPPPPEHVAALLEDLCLFVNRDDLPGTVQAAIAHAQFETIHPFGDGNGRTGRALIHVVLKRRDLTPGFVPPISLALATRASAYIDGLSRFRYLGSANSPSAIAGLRDWLDLFLSATRRATSDAAELQSKLKLLAEDVMRLTGASRSAAFSAVESCIKVGLLRTVGNQQRYRLFEAPEVFEVLTGYERASATESGDTRREQPKRSVPYR